MVSAGDDDLTTAPAIVMVASAMRPSSLVVPAPAELGRLLRAAGTTHELADERLSRDHATVRWERGTWVIRDLESRNGTFVGGERIGGEVKRRGEVVLRLGHTLFVLVPDGRGHPAPPAGDLVIGPELRRAYDRLHALAPGGRLLVEGGEGSGKQLAARAFHEAGPRASGPFVMVRCGAISGVADRLLFGYRRGVVETIGQLQLAQGGTLYLAELGMLDPVAQGALLKRLATDLDCNLVCSGHDLRAAVAEGRLRGELLERLAPVSISIPPLWTRRVDLARLVQLEVAEQATEQGVDLAVHSRFLEACVLRPWPGNARELRAAVRYAIARALADDRRTVIRVDDLLASAGLPPGATSAETAVERRGSSGQGRLGRANLIAAMVGANNVLTVAARSLGIHRSQLTKLLEEHDIPYEGTHED